MNEWEVKEFIFGLSIIETYISHCKPLNLQDISIFSENFICNLMNSLYNLNFSNENDKRQNNPGYDLISVENRIIVQVTTTTSHRQEKILETLKVLDAQIIHRNKIEEQLKKLKLRREKQGLNDEELSNQRRLELQICDTPNIDGYRLYFIFLCSDVKETKEYFFKHGIEEYLTKNVKFDYIRDIYDFNSFILKFKSISEMDSQFDVVKQFMKRNSQIFFSPDKRISTSNRIMSVIDEYSKNFIKPLFQHTYSNNKNVTLKNMYIDPLFTIEHLQHTSRDFLKIYDDFLRKDRKGRILFIEGDAAIGKTSLVSWLCYHYKQRDNTIQRNPFGGAIYCNRDLVCVRLRDLRISTTNNILLSLLEYFDIEEVFFRKQYSKAIFILDGADELKFQSIGQETNNIEVFISNLRSLFPDAKFIITSRPLYINKNQLQSDIYKFQTITFSHYSKSMREEWVEKFCATGERLSDETREYILGLDDGVADGVADTPLALYLLSSCEIKESLRGNNWALYNKIFHNAIVTTEYNENIKLGAGNSHPISDNIGLLYPIIGKIAYWMFQHSKESISNDELREIIQKSDHGNLTSERIQKLCLLCSYWARTENQSVIEFYHNNIRDFFFAEFIYAQLQENKSKISNSISLEEFISLFCKFFCYGKVASTTWEQTFSFLYLHFKYDLLYETNEKIAIFSQISCKNTQEAIEALLKNDAFWNSEHSGRYQSIKTIFYNFFMFIQIIAEGTLSGEKINRKLFNSNVSLLKEIFSDWYTIYTQRIKISNELIIGSGSYTHWNNSDNYGKIFDNAYFHSAVFENVTFTKASLQKVSFTNSELTNVDFSFADLTDADFTNAKLTNVNFDHSILTGSIFHETVIKDCTWKNTDLNKIDFSKSKLYGINWNSKKLSGNINQCYFENCKLKRTVVSNSICDVQYINCDLSSIDLNSIFLDNISFINSVLESAQLYGSRRISKCIFEGGSIKNANFNKSLIKECEFIKTNLSNCDFQTTELIDTVFVETKLQNMRLFNTLANRKSYNNILNQGEKLKFDQLKLVK